MPADFVKLLTGVFAEVLDGRNAYLTDGVQYALGRPPRDFRDFARDAAATGIWNDWTPPRSTEGVLSCPRLLGPSGVEAVNAYDPRSRVPTVTVGAA